MKKNDFKELPNNGESSLKASLAPRLLLLFFYRNCFYSNRNGRRDGIFTRHFLVAVFVVVVVGVLFFLYFRFSPRRDASYSRGRPS